MNKQNLRPQATQPVHRTTTGQLPPELSELSEETLHLQGDASSPSVLPSGGYGGITNPVHCSYDGDDAE